MKIYKKRLRKNKIKSKLQELALKLSLIICIILAMKYSVDGIVYFAEHIKDNNQITIEFSREVERQDDEVVKAHSRETEQFEGLKALEVEVPTTPSLSIENKIREAFPECPDMALAVVKCESSFEVDRVGDTGFIKPSIGLFQINQYYHPYSEETLKNPDENIRIAREIYDKSGGSWDRWTCGRMLAQK